MTEREKQRPRTSTPTPRDGESPQRDALPGFRTQAERLLDGADEAIERILSSDSRSFIEANSQRGGQ